MKYSLIEQLIRYNKFNNNYQVDWMIPWAS